MIHNLWHSDTDIAKFYPAHLICQKMHHDVRPKIWGYIYWETSCSDIGRDTKSNKTDNCKGLLYDVNGDNVDVAT